MTAVKSFDKILYFITYPLLKCLVIYGWILGCLLKTPCLVVVGDVRFQIWARSGIILATNGTNLRLFKIKFQYILWTPIYPKSEILVVVSHSLSQHRLAGCQVCQTQLSLSSAWYISRFSLVMHFLYKLKTFKQ